MSSLTMLDLFSGIGGFSIAAESCGIETVAFCEIEPYPRSVLNRNWPYVPVFPDVKELTADALAHTDSQRRTHRREEHVQPSGQSASDRASGTIDIICGGFPCQDISVAGAGAGLADGTRSGLYREIVRLTRDLRPRWLLLENVAALLTRGIGDVLGDFSALGYDAVWAAVPACAVGAPHRRDRVWIALTNTDADLEALYAHVLDGITQAGAPSWQTPVADDCVDRAVGKYNSRGEPKLSAQARSWPTATATASDHKGSGPTVIRNDGKDRRHDRLDYAVEQAGCAPAGSLNPDWVEALMGYPVGWTLPEGEPMRDMADRWPAGCSASQHDWEPPRLTAIKEHRANRLKALGNAIVPQVARLWFSAIDAVIEP